MSLSGDLAGERLQELSEHRESVQPFVDRVIRGFEKGVHEGSREITLYRGVGRRCCCAGTLHSRRTPPWQPGHAGIRRCHRGCSRRSVTPPGERWRGAQHEIKNPLTPIQLSARAPAPQIPG